MTILNETTELIQKGSAWGLDLSSDKCWALLMLGSVLVALSIWVLFNSLREKIGFKIFCICVTIFGILSLIMAFHTKPIYEKVKQYEATINSSTPFYTIYDNYDIIEQRGDIFVLRDKNQEDNN